MLFASRDTSGSAINTDRQVSIDPEIYELYIDLLCQFKPGDVANYVKMSEGYRLEQTLAVSPCCICCNITV